MVLIHSGWGQSIVFRGRPGYLGVGIADVTPERAKALKLPEAAGVEVKLVDEKSPALKAGLKVDDVILEINGQKVENRTQFIGTIGVSAPGTRVTLTIWREGSKQTLNATLEPRGLSFAYRTDSDGVAPLEMPLEIMPLPSPLIGINGETLTPQLADYFGVTAGVLVRTVAPKTPAEKAGLKAGDVVVKVNGMAVDSIREITGIAHAAHTAYVFTVVRNHKEITLNVELALEFVPWPERRLRGGWSLALFRSQ
jgi:serine protease Do